MSRQREMPKILSLLSQRGVQGRIVRLVIGWRDPFYTQDTLAKTTVERSFTGSSGPHPVEMKMSGRPQFRHQNREPFR